MRVVSFLILSILICGLPLKAQDGVLPKDEHGFYTFYEVVNVPGIDAATLIANAKAQLKSYINKKFKKKIVVDKTAGTVNAKSQFLVYKRGSLGKNVDGAIQYSISIEVKENKYRYIISDFMYQPYHRNRYGRFEPDGRLQQLERSVGKLSEWEWNAHKQYTREKIETLITELKLTMGKKTSEKDDHKISIDDEW